VDIGDTVIYGGTRFVVRGIDPAGVDPRCVYLEDAKTGQTVSITLEDPPPRTLRDTVLHLVGDDEPA
jgi:hypothetical protein